MVEILFIVDEVLCVACIFALAFFCAVIPKTGIAKYLYILFGITLLPVGIRFVLNGEPWYQYIWIFLFAAAGMIVGIVLIGYNHGMNKEEQKKFDRDFGAMARRNGKRNLFKQLWKLKK